MGANGAPRRARRLVAVVAMLVAAPALAGETALLFECAYNEEINATRAAGRADKLSATGVRLVEGRKGMALRLGTDTAPASIAYSAPGNIDVQRGTIEFDVKLDWDYTQNTSRSKRVWFDIGGTGNRNRFYLHSAATALLFGIFDDTGTIHHVSAGDVSAWRAGEWHHVACAWDLPKKRMTLALDGVLASDAPSNRTRGSWRVDAGDLKTIRLGGHGNMGTPLDGSLDNLRILDRARTLPADPSTNPAPDARTLRDMQRQAADALRDLRNAIDRAERAGIDASYAAAVATAAGTGRWRMNRSPHPPSPKDIQEYCRYMLKRCAEARAELAQLARDRRWERRVPRPDVHNLKIVGDGFRTAEDEEVLLVGARNVYENDYAELSRFFNLLAWGSAPSPRRRASTRRNRFAAQAHLFWTKPLEKALEQYPQMRNVGGWCGHNWATDLCIESDRSRAIVESEISNLPILTQGPDPAVLYGLLSAEDAYMCYCDRSITLFQGWLRRRYGSVDDVNRVWSTNAASIDAVRPPRLTRTGINPKNRAAWHDWQQFNRDRTTHTYAWLKSLVRRFWPTVPLCGGTHIHLADNRWGTHGVDVEKLNDQINDVMQCETVYDLPTAAVAFGAPPYGLDLFGEAFLDYQRSTCNKPATDLEYHAWLRYAPALAARHEQIPAKYTYTAILRHYLHGIRAANMWVWNRRDGPLDDATAFGYSPTQPLESVEALLRAALDVRRLSRDIIALSRAPRQVAIMVSDSSFLQVPPSLARSHVDSPLTVELDNVYHGSMFLDTPIGFVSERSIARGVLANHCVVLVPAISHIDDTTLAALLRFVDGGGTLVVTPRSFVFDPHHQPRAVVDGFPNTQNITFVGLLEEPSPAQLRDPDFIERQAVDPGDPRVPATTLIMTDDAPAGLAGQRLEGTGVRLGITPDDAVVIARSSDDNRPGIVRLDRGDGRIWYCAIPLRPKSYARLVEPILRDTGVDRPIRLRSATGAPLWGVEARSVRIGDDLLVYAINLLAAPVEVRLACEQEILGVHDLVANRPGGVTFRLDALETAILRLKVAP